MKFFLIKTALFFLIINSLTVKAVELVNLEEFPSWFKNAVARETKVEKKTELEIKQLNVKSIILGNATLGDLSDGTWYYVIDIGTDSPVECYVFTDFDGPANSLNAMVELSLTGVEALNKKTLSDRFNFAMDSKVTNKTPYLLLDTLYSLGEGKNKVSGVIKALSAKTNETLQICLHNELGYRKSFLDVFKSFVHAFAQKQKSSEFFEAIYQMKFNGKPIGYSHEKFSLDNDGDIEMINDTAILLPVDANSVSRSDSLTTSWSNPNGDLINMNEYSVDNGVLSSRFAISKKDEKWQVEGELQGKPVNATLQHNERLLSDFGSYLEVANILKSDKNAKKLHIWIPDADPTSATEISVIKMTKSPKTNIKLIMGPIVMEYLADENGVLQKGNMDLGGMNVELGLLHSFGKPILP